MMNENDFLMALNTLERPDRRLRSAIGGVGASVFFCILGCALWYRNMRGDGNECR